MSTVEYNMTMRGAAVISLSWLLAGCAQTIRENSVTPHKEMMVRVAEIEVHPNHLDEYKAILKEEADASVKLEPGVISIFPMYREEHPTEIRILEIYASRASYESHIESPHFQKYKTSTLKMVKALRLVDMVAIDAPAMTEIFRKKLSAERPHGTQP